MCAGNMCGLRKKNSKNTFQSSIIVVQALLPISKNYDFVLTHGWFSFNCARDLFELYFLNDDDEDDDGFEGGNLGKLWFWTKLGLT